MTIRALAACLALILSFETGTAHAAPSPRDLAYEQGVQAEEAGDHARAAAEFTRAYQLTPAGETGPRLLFLRASVAARLRARDAGGLPREHLCQARALLREHLAGPAGADPLADPLQGERASLAAIERDLGDIDCDALEPTPEQPVPTTSPDPAPGRPVPTTSPDPAAERPVPEDTSAPTLAIKRPVPEDISTPSPGDGRSPRLVRGFRIAGTTSLGVSVAAFVTMGVGIGLARAATREGRALCWSAPEACDGFDTGIKKIVDEGRRAEQIVKIAAPIAGVALLSGIILLSLALPGRAAPARVAPRMGPGALGFGLQGRF